MLSRLGAWLAGVWAGAIAALGLVAAPTLFATLARADAGRVAGRLFELDAYLGIAVGAALLLVAMQRSHDAGERGGTRFSVELGLVLAALFCIVAGYFAVQPLMEAARRGEGGASFAVLHGVASAFYLVKLIVVAVLAWRLGASAVALASAGEVAKAVAPTS